MIRRLLWKVFHRALLTEYELRRAQTMTRRALTAIEEQGEDGLIAARACLYELDRILA